MATQCQSCTQHKATLQCGLCQIELCKSCTQFVDHDQFSLMPQIPAELTHSVYCQDCFASKIAPAIEDYQQTVEQARNIIIFEKDQGKETRFVKRIEKPIQIVDCADQQDIFLRLAYRAVKAKYNAVIDVDTKSKKVKSNGYQTTIWTGSGVLANVQDHMLMKDRALWQNPN